MSKVMIISINNIYSSKGKNRGSMSIERIKAKLNDMASDLDANNIKHLESLIDNFKKSIIPHSVYVNKLKSNEWYEADNPMMICGSDESDKKSRASAIFSLFVESRIGDNSKVLDYGCGEGHFVMRCAEETKVTSVVGYDIVNQQWDRFDTIEKVVFTTDPKTVSDIGPYNVIVLYDVIDHVVDRHPLEVLKHVKSLLDKDGMIIMRCHPWSGRHGTHLWKLNKAYAHLVFTEEELAEMGHVGLPTYKVMHPRKVYLEWIENAGFKIIWQNLVARQAGPIFERNPELKAKMLAHYGGPNGSFHYDEIEEVFRDFVLKSK